MKIKTLLTCFAALILAVPAFSEEEDTPLAKEMSAMNKSLRLLKRQIDDPTKKEDNLALLAKIKENSTKAHDFKPATTEKQPEAEKAAYVEEYQKEIIQLGEAYGKLEAAIRVDKTDEAKAALDAIYDLKKKGHDKFVPEDEK